VGCEVKTRYTYLGDSTIEVVVDGEEVSVNILPTITEVKDVPPNDLLLLQTTEPVPSKPRRGLKAWIRGVWTFAFTVFGEGLSYLVQNVSGLDLPPGAGAMVGASAAGLAYGIKKYISPDTLI
jgi:hypothetical protein